VPLLGFITAGDSVFRLQPWRGVTRSNLATTRTRGGAMLGILEDFALALAYSALGTFGVILVLDLAKALLGG